VPLPNTRLVPERFQEYHQATVRGQMTAECVITRPASGTPTYNPTTITSTFSTPTQVYAGICRVRGPITGDAAVAVADREMAYTAYPVTIPIDSPAVQRNDLVEVTKCPDDPALVGVKLRVLAAQRGSIVWQRDLACELAQPTTR
jgi:hypothetical protein